MPALRGTLSPLGVNGTSDEISMGPMETTGGGAGHPPGHITKPMRAWTRSRSLTFGFYEWPPYADSFRFFSKRSGVVLGTEVLVPVSQLELPNLVKSTDEDAAYSATRYIEFTLEGLKPNSRYTLKVTPVGMGGYGVGDREHGEEKERNWRFGEAESGCACKCVAGQVTPVRKGSKQTAKSTIHTISDEEMNKRDSFMRRLVGMSLHS
jgi:hypothetical protein